MFKHSHSSTLRFNPSDNEDDGSGESAPYDSVADEVKPWEMFPSRFKYKDDGSGNWVSYDPVVYETSPREIFGSRFKYEDDGSGEWGPHGPVVYKSMPREIVVPSDQGILPVRRTMPLPIQNSHRSSVSSYGDVPGLRVMRDAMENQKKLGYKHEPAHLLQAENGIRVESSTDQQGLQTQLHSAIFQPAQQNKECLICTESLSSIAFPSHKISSRCTHEPLTCLSCLAKSIKSDLENRMWNEIYCPECRALLDYHNVREYASMETFSRYESLSVRGAMGNASDFAWCRGPGCESGQIHDGGAEQPIMTCLVCRFRTCFFHQVAWHERLTCEEYDDLQRDPDRFQSRIEKEEAELAAQQQAKAAQECEDEEMAKNMAREIEIEEQQRVQELEENALTARSLAEVAVARWRHEAEDKKRCHDAAEEKTRREGEKEERNRAREEEAERLHKAAQKAKRAMKQRARDEAASLKMISSITKNCPGKGCGWPIEKNDGCAHMICIKCQHEFCWDCLKDYGDIRRLGNSRHGRRCPFHSDNIKN